MEAQFVEFIESLNNNGVKYLLVGGYAVAYHGFIRATKDIDFFIADTRSNIDKLRQAIAEFFGVDPQQIKFDSFYQENKIIQLGVAPNRIDILKKIEGVTFDEIYPKRVEDIIDGVRVAVIDLDSLIKNKKAAGRDSDLIDVKKLERKKK